GSSRRRVQGQRVTRAVAPRVRPRSAVAQAVGKSDRMESGSLQDHSRDLARILTVIIDVDVDRGGSWRLRGYRAGGGGRIVADATVGRVLRGDRHQRVPSAGNLRA